METVTTCKWPAPPLERRDFASWEDFFAYMKEYEQHTYQAFSPRSLTSVKKRNQVLASFAATGRPLPSPLLPDRFQDYVRVLQCSHRNRGKAARPHTYSNEEAPFECYAKIIATLQLVEDGNYRVCVTKVNLLHNHPLTGHSTPASAVLRTPSAVLSETHSTKRRRTVRSQSNLEFDETKIQAQASLELTDVPTMADVREFLQRVKKMHLTQRDVPQSVEERLVTYVNEFAALDGNAAQIFIDDEVLSSITLQTKHMRKVFEAFPEVLRVDVMPHLAGNEADSNYSVFSLMAHDVLGNWQHVQHAIVESDRSETLQNVLDQFKKHNARHVRVRALFVPCEDFPDLKNLLLSFPAARVLYSQFHVLRVLQQAISDHGQDLTSWHRDRLTSISRSLVYAPTAPMYNAEIATMADVLGSKHHPFYRYFLKTWDSCCDRWTTFARQDVTTFSLSEHDGQFASLYKEIIAAVNEEMALDETVAAIHYYQTVVERAFIRVLNTESSAARQSAIRSGSNSEEYDAEMRLLASAVSPAVSNMIFPQYRYAISRDAYQFVEPNRGSFFVSAVVPNEVFCDEPAKEFSLEADKGWQCSCAFMVNHCLPCRHVFYIRRIVRCSTLVPMEHIEPRWVLARAKAFFESPVEKHLTSAVADSIDGDMKQDLEYGKVVPPPGAWHNYVAAQEVGKRISQRMMEMDLVEFDRALRFYKLVEAALNVRPFNLDAAVVARQKSQPGGASSTPVRQPNYVKPESTRSLAQLASLSGTINEGPALSVSAATIAGDMQSRQVLHRPVLRPKPSSVIDLQDESADEMDYSVQLNG